MQRIVRQFDVMLASVTVLRGVFARILLDKTHVRRVLLRNYRRRGERYPSSATPNTRRRRVVGGSRRQLCRQDAGCDKCVHRGMGACKLALTVGRQSAGWARNTKAATDATDATGATFNLTSGVLEGSEPQRTAVALWLARRKTNYY
jgi:hypothetical protein